jgi:hypothetical protein
LGIFLTKLAFGHQLKVKKVVLSSSMMTENFKKYLKTIFLGEWLCGFQGALPIGAWHCANPKWPRNPVSASSFDHLVM